MGNYGSGENFNNVKVYRWTTQAGSQFFWLGGSSQQKDFGWSAAIARGHSWELMRSSPHICKGEERQKSIEMFK